MPLSTLGDPGNFCRGPSLMQRAPWCFTTNSDVSFDYCDVPYCREYQACKALLSAEVY